MTQAVQPSVLLVDDRPEKLLALEAILADLPVDLVRATSGRDALRQLLQRDFAAILLDVNMPGMDGFETAQLIRQRKNSEHTPIIFCTAYADEMFMSRGYSLGAVDYILQPVMPAVLRSKVSVFVDLYRKNQIVSEQVRWQQQRARQLQRLADASVAINAAPSLRQTLQLITDTARDLIGAHQAITLFLLDADPAPRPGQTQAFSSFSDKYADWRGRPLLLDAVGTSSVARSRTATRLTAEAFREHPDHAIVMPLVEAGQIPPVEGFLAAPLLGRDGRNIGVIYVADKADGDGGFSDDDEAILVQLSQMGTIAIENLFSAEAREANRAKDQFIAVLSHELRTPLSPVLATLSGLTEDKRLPPDVAEDLAMIRRNVELEARLIDDLLDLTRIAKGKIELQLAPCDAHLLLRETIDICRADAAVKGLNLIVDLSAKSHYIPADATRVKQVFWNLIKNAVKFTPPRGHVRVETTNGPDGAFTLTVSDSGIGIEADVLPRIFAAFEQGRSAITRQFGGLGLGLAISKALVDHHGGSLVAASEGKNRGATFTAAFPVTQERPRQQPRRAAGNTAANGSHEHAPARRLLLVEDHHDTSRVMARLLRGAGYTVDCAATVAEAVGYAGKYTYDVLVSDIGLPDGSGLEVMRHLRDRHTTIGIALSGFGMQQDVTRSKEAGFTEHLTKPVQPDVLLESLDRVTRPAEGTPITVHPAEAAKPAPVAG